MKRLIIAVCFIALVIGIVPAIAGGNLQVSIDQQWSRVEAWQKQQAKRFKAIERDAARSLKALEKEHKHDAITWGAASCLSWKRQEADRK
jgi:hypothetical protein